MVLKMMTMLRRCGAPAFPSSLPVAASLVLLSTTVVPGARSDPLSEARLPPGYTVTEFSSGHGRARGLRVLPNGDVLLATGVGQYGPDASGVTLLWDDDGDGAADGTASLVGDGLGLTHGIEYLRPENNPRGENEGWILASSDTTVYAWPYALGERLDEELGGRFVVVSNMNARSNAEDLGAFRGHWTRTLALSPGDQRYLYVSVGSAGNVDNDSYRSRIRRFDLRTMVEGTPFDFREGEVFADGLRNEVGLAFDAAGVLWGVENGADRLKRADLGGDIHQDNPAEELNKFDGAVGTHYGYPWCWTEYELPAEYGMGRGTVWAWPDTMNTFRNDDWCRTNSRLPELSMQGHSAPLGLTFFDKNAVANGPDEAFCSGIGGTFPSGRDGDLYIGFHGSWNRDIPTGYKVVHVPFDGPGGSPIGEVIDLFWHGGNGARWPSRVRPVDVAFDRCGRLLVSDDGAGFIFLISFDGTVSPSEESKDTSEFPGDDSGIPNLLPTTGPSEESKETSEFSGKSSSDQSKTSLWLNAVVLCIAVLWF